MYIFKTSGETFNSVISNEKHAFKGMPSKWIAGELILVSKNKSDCINGEKQIQFIMKLKKIRSASQVELESLWPGNQGRWNYIADCYDTVKLIKPFNLEDVLGDNSKPYAPVMTFKKICKEDEDRINEFISGSPEIAILPLFEEEYIPSDDEDGRKRTLASIVSRRGQPAFRKVIMTAYSGKCAVTGCDAKEALEAAHITPYMGDQTNHVQNGLLLRADIHTLFDLGLIAVSPIDFRIILHSSLRVGYYGYLDGKMISVPSNKECWPSTVALKTHLASSPL
jgi:hypothetical protein